MKQTEMFSIMLSFSDLWTSPRLSNFREDYPTIEIAIYLGVKLELATRRFFVVLRHSY